MCMCGRNIIFMAKSKLTLLKEKAKRHKKRNEWLNKYKCECGAITFQRAYNVKNGIVRSCGCIHIKNTPPSDSLLTFVCKTNKRINHHVCNKYKCKCGRMVIKQGVLVRNGSIKSCGCLIKLINEKNRKYHAPPKDSKLQFIRDMGVGNHGLLAEYKCECGNIKINRKSSVNSGAVKSCGCLQKEKTVKHGQASHKKNTRIYTTWVGMRRRCRERKGYVDRNIKVCKEWNKNFTTFYEWAIKNGYRDDLQIDRMNNNGNYEPSNCQWTTIKVNSNNRRSNLGVEKIKQIKILLSKGLSPAQVKKTLGYGAVSHIRHIRNGKYHSDITI